MSLKDLVFSILSLIQKDTIAKDPTLLHPAFKEMQERVPMPLLSGLVFDLSSSIPFSKELDDALKSLEESDLLINADGHYLMSETRIQQINTLLRFSEAEKQQIYQCAAIICKYFPQDTSNFRR